jgi:tRNA pseudouridine38-40 synthase
MTEPGQRYFIQLSFNGKNYCGWQTQKNGNSVQSELNSALSTLLRKKINVVGCGRTDAGVHAEKFFAHFEVKDIDLLSSKERLIDKWNRFLPKDIVIKDLFAVDQEANARFSAVSRTYEYRISLVKDPFLEELTFYFPGLLDIQLMNDAANIIKEYSDFTSFSKLHTQTATNNCKISEASWRRTDNHLIFSITSNRFLRNMVRAIVGTLLDIGRKKINLKDLREIIESKNRSNAGTSVPAKGLFLVDIRYPETILAIKDLK